MNNEKCQLWISRVNDFNSSGMTCKAWCAEHQIPVSTMRYWIRKVGKNESGQTDFEPVFAKLPSEQEISSETNGMDPAPIHIFISQHIHVEIMPSCPPVLLQTFVGALKGHA